MARFLKVLALSLAALSGVAGCAPDGSPSTEFRPYPMPSATPPASTLPETARPTASCTASDLSGEPAQPTGPFTLVSGEMYVVYSELRQADNPGVVETSNIYLIRGQADAEGVDVWIFGNGYGDGAGLDYFPYPRTEQYPSRGAVVDAGDVHAVIRDCLAVEPSQARLHLVAPHYHFDHMNYEFVAALLAGGYALEATSLYVHDLDFDPMFCGQSCAGTATGGGSLPAFPAEVQNRTVRLGASDDACGTTVLSFESPALGTWNVLTNALHTAGSLAIDNAELGVRLKGAAQTCLPGYGLRQIEQHKGIATAWGSP